MLALNKTEQAKEAKTYRISKVRSVFLSLSSSFRHIFASDSTLMQLHLRHKYHWHLLISTVTFCCLSRLCFGSPTMDIFTPTLFCIFSYGRFSTSASGPVQEKQGEVGRGAIHRPPTRNYSMWWYKSHLIMWDCARFASHDERSEVFKNTWRSELDHRR